MMFKLAAFVAAGAGALLASTALSAQEYRSNMTQIGVTPTLHAKEGTGAGVKIGILDGLADRNHYDLAGRTLNFTYNGGTYTAFALHGTHVSGIAAASAGNGGVVGVAPGATIYNYGVFDDTSWRATDLGRAALDHAKANGVSVVNMSYGPAAGGGDLFLNGELNLFDDYKSAMVIVRAAGNDGKNAKYESYAGDASSNLGHILIVGSVDSNNKISSFSNRAGTACIGPKTSCAADDKVSNFFIVAPGRSIVSDGPGNTLWSMSGTSMATPHVTGAVALLQGKWPHLKNDPVGTAGIIKQTATDLGAKGVDAVFGWGLLNVPKAMQPVGTTVVATGSTVSQGGTPTTRSRKASRTRSLPRQRSVTDALGGLVVFDDYGRDFEADMSGTEAFVEQPVSIEDRLGALSLALDIAPAASSSGAIALGFQASVDTPSHEGFEVASLSGEGIDLKIGRGASQLYFQANEVNVTGGAPQSVGRHMMLGLNEVGEAFSDGAFADGSLALSETVSLGAFFASSESFVSEDVPGGLAAALVQQAGQPEAEMMGFQASYRVDSGTTLGFAYGRLIEQDRLLGVESAGAFSLSDTTTTQTFGASLSLALTDQWSAVLFYDYAMIDATAASNSLYQGIDSWSGQKFGATFAYDGPFTGDDRLSVTLMQPLHVNAGEGSVKVPVGRDIAGNVLYEQRRFSVDSDAVPLELAMSYVDRGESFSKGVTLSFDDQDVRDAGEINVNLVAALKWQF
ncbi:MAG: S8 family serine peptidase [Alphaproteobacteria bacterium]